MNDDSSDNEIDIDTLIEQCRSESADAQLDAMRALSDAGARRAASAVMPLLSSDDAFVRDAAIRCLAILGRDHCEEIGPAIEALVDDPEDMVRNQAVEVLGLLRYAPARRTLERVLGADEEWVVRASAAEALGELGISAALPALSGALDDELYPVRSYAAFAIGQLGDAGHLPVIRQRLAVEIHPMPRAELLAVALRLGDESAFDDLLALARDIHDNHSAGYVFHVVTELLAERTPAVVMRRGRELGDELLAMGRHVGSDEEYVEELVARLAALAPPPGT